MLVTYFDEVKCNTSRQPYYWLGGIISSAETIWSLEAQVAELSREIFGTPNLSRETEFHAAEIFHRKRNFKEWSEVSKRLDVLKRLLVILNNSDVGKIYARIDPAKMVASDPEKKAFIFFTERVDWYLRTKKCPGILIGDRENDRVSDIFAGSLSRYRSTGTPYEFGNKLTHLIDTVHFTNSHHSRMLQLADLYVWTLQFCASPNNEASPRSDLVDFIRNSTRLLIPNHYKEWPTEQSWIRV
ncbi:MAG: DUF3800 domain-containing protein [Vulcanimicrobiaceae bacterium]